MAINKAINLNKSHRIKYENEAAARSALIEFLIYMCFLVITIFVATSSRNMSMYFYNRGIENLFLAREVQTSTHESSVKFANLATTFDMWAFLETKFINDLHSKHEEDPLKEENKNEKKDESPNKDKQKTRRRRRRAVENKLIFLEENLVLGPPRLRQIRVREGSCDVHDVFGRYFSTCFSDYSSSSEDTSSEFKGTNYKTLSELGAYGIWTEITTYRSGGFVKSLTYNYEENKAILAELKKQKWIDRATRLVLVEFTLFNANKNLGNNIKFIGELPSTGGVLTSYSIQSVKLGSVFWKDGFLICLAGIIFYIFIIYYAIIEVLEMRALGFANYVRLLWNFVDFLIIFLAFFTFVYNIWHPIYLNQLYKRFDENPKEYLELDPLCFWNLVYRDVMGICAFLVCIKIFKFISFNKTMRQFNATVSTCFRDLLGFGVMFGIVFLAYAQLGLLLFGNVHYDFRNFHESLITMIRMILGDFDYDSIEAANRVLGPIYFLTYILLVFFILLNMFLAIINDTYSAVKSDIKGGRNHLTQYLRNCFSKYCPKCCRRKPQEDEEIGAAPVRSPDVRPQVQRDNVLDFFEPVRDRPVADPATVNRLNSRVAALEDVIEQIVADVDRTMRKIKRPRRRPRPAGADSSS
ncbi:polycystin-2-like protein 2 [Eurosta solidaginis]|uniref:polycystin-2-like protein 2 n=1 Tax=Eurosta solidaginis TaxID=178769 RepID=UPI003530E669